MAARRLRTIARLAFRNPASLAYLGLVAATAVFVTIDTLFVAHEDASFAGVSLLLVSAPTIIAFFVGGDALGVDVVDSDVFFYTALPLSVLVQSFALGWFVRLLGRTSARTARPQGA
ncbi:SCO4225 family membrane protein [Streptomyces albidochromogenes]|uniref:SCO4225 family membrane protein n=1 Tax=Streptomyces albidochromogenes TaxID=329524 RepID=A0ABW6FVT7_9ACTN